MVRIDSEGASNVELWARERLAAPGISDSLRSAIARLAEELETERLREHDTFLSVVIRTQAKRWEQLQDALLCLNAQTDQDFELLLMLHEVDAETERRIRELVDLYPSAFASRVRLIAVRGGGRTRPLAASLEHIRGEYVAFYDDDDLLMADWVEAFHQGARRAPGQVIRSNVAVQANRAEEWTDGSRGQRTVGLATAEYLRGFDLLEHLERNHSPFMGLAFPSSFFLQWGERFDEELPVCEDWDVLMRAAKLVGVTSVPELTAIYRQWDDVATSYTRHDEEEWRAAEARIRNRLDASPALLSAGFVRRYLDALAAEREITADLGKQLAGVLDSTMWRATAPVRGLLGRLRRR